MIQSEDNQRMIAKAARTAVLMAMLTIFSKGFGFLREMFLAGYYGVSYVVDAYVMANTILSVMFGGIVSAISIAYMPIFSRIKEEKGKIEGDLFTSRIINFLICITIIISLIGIFFSDQIVAVLAGNFEGETAILTSVYIKVIFSYIIFSSISAILESYLQYKNIFIPQILCGYLISICTMLGIIISAYTSSYYLAFGMLTGYIFRAIAICYFARRGGFQYKKSIVLKTEGKELLRLALPVFIGSYMLYINLFVDKSLASSLPEGTIAALNYASILNTTIIGLSVTVMATIIYPKLAQANSLQQPEIFSKIAEMGISLVIIIGLPCSLGAMLYGRQIIQIVYERGAFNTSDTEMTASVFVFYAAGLLFMALNEFMIKVYYSMHETKLPMIFGVISVIVNIMLNLILIKSMQHNGLALATSIAAVVNTFMLYLGIKFKYKGINIFLDKVKFVKICMAATLAIALSYIGYQIIILYLSQWIFVRGLQLFLAVNIAVVAYCLLLKFFKVKEIDLIRKLFIREKNL